MEEAGRCCWGFGGAVVAVGRVGALVAGARPADRLRGMIDVVRDEVWCCGGWKVEREGKLFCFFGGVGLFFFFLVWRWILFGPMGWLVFGWGRLCTISEQMSMLLNGAW